MKKLIILTLPLSMIPCLHSAEKPKKMNLILAKQETNMNTLEQVTEKIHPLQRLPKGTKVILLALTESLKGDISEIRAILDKKKNRKS